MTPLKTFALSTASALSLALALAGAQAQAASQPAAAFNLTTADGQWPTIGGDKGLSKYSPLNQITTANVGGLKVAWSYKAGGAEITPIVVDGVMYYPSGTKVVALDATTGKEVWVADLTTLIPDEGQGVNAARGANLQLRGAAPPPPTAAQAQAAAGPRYLRLGGSSKYGVSYWPGVGRTGPRIVLATQNGYLVQLDARTGAPVKTFGHNGAIDLRVGAMEGMNLTDYTPGALPTIYKNLAIVTPRTGEQGRYGPPGDPRAFDLVTGKEVWRFHVVPHPGEANFGTWGLNGWQDRRGPGSWIPITVDYTSGTVFIVTGNATDQDYGAYRPGDNLYATSVLALDGDTGKLKWHYQTTHHDIYDWDVSSPSVLAEITKDGRKIPVVLQNTKQGYLFVLDRATGKPVFPVVEKPMPASDAPGEVTSPTQPVPLKPGPIARVGMTRDEVANLSPASHAACLAIYDKVLQMGEGTPYSMVPTLVFPSSTGGGTFGGATYDPNSNLIFVNDKQLGTIAMLTPQLSSQAFESLAKSKLPFSDPDGYPCSGPPWGELMAINADTGDTVWRQPLGEYKELTARGVPKTGTDNAGGSIVTAGGLLFIGASQDKMFRAFEARTGKELWSMELAANAGSTPLTYRGRDGKQYVAVSIGGRGAGASGEVVAFALP
jgi:quinoprotein glucose dehydrogenase